MLNEFYEFIAKKVNSFFQKAASDGTLLKGESFCLKLDNDDMVAKVSSALKHLAEENKIIGIYELVCRDRLPDQLYFGMQYQRTRDRWKKCGDISPSSVYQQYNYCRRL